MELSAAICRLRKQSRVLTNFDGGLGDVVTLAHELGHAYHGLNIESHRPLNWEYSMPVAETASTFNENIIMNAVIDETEDKEVKLGLIEISFKTYVRSSVIFILVTYLKSRI